MALGDHTIGFGSREKLLHTLERLRFWSSNAPPSEEVTTVNRIVSKIKGTLGRGRTSLTLNEEELTTFMQVLEGKRVPLGEVFDTLPGYDYSSSTEYLPIKESYNPSFLSIWESEDYPRITTAKN